MWWIEVLPSAILMGACIGAVGVINMGFQKLTNGGKLRRRVETKFDWALLERDRRLDELSFAWRTKGLENLGESKSN